MAEDEIRVHEDETATVGEGEFRVLEDATATIEAQGQADRELSKEHWDKVMKGRVRDREEAMLRSLMFKRNLVTIQSCFLRGDYAADLEGEGANDAEAHALLVDQVRQISDESKEGKPYKKFWKPRQVPYAGEETEGQDGLMLELEPANMSRVFPSRRVWDGLELHWIKVLGLGGFGIATLWEAVFDNGKRRKVAIKMSPDGSRHFNSRQELYWHRRYHGARHTVQALDLANMAAEARAEAEADEANANHERRGVTRRVGETFDQGKLNVMALEYMDKGDLWSLLAVASHKKVRFPNRVLWELWQCLVLGVGSVAFQPVMQDEAYSYEECVVDPDHRGGLIPVGNETHDVHFDLEEQNVLLDTADPTHKNAPIFKLHDFGSFSHEMRKCWETWDYKQYVEARNMPKLNRALPEQIHEDWDFFDSRVPPDGSHFTPEDPSSSAPETSKSKVAGSRREGEGKEQEADQSIDTGGGGNVSSYGERLKSPAYSFADSELIDVLIYCQAEQPDLRPNVIELAEMCKARIDRGFDETDEQIRDFWRQMWEPTPEETLIAEMRRPRPPPPPCNPPPPPANPLPPAPSGPGRATGYGGYGQGADTFYHGQGADTFYHGQGAAISFHGQGAATSYHGQGAPTAYGQGAPTAHEQPHGVPAAGAAPATIATNPPPRKQTTPLFDPKLVDPKLTTAYHYAIASESRPAEGMADLSHGRGKAGSLMGFMGLHKDQNQAVEAQQATDQQSSPSSPSRQEHSARSGLVQAAGPRVHYSNANAPDAVDGRQGRSTVSANPMAARALELERQYGPTVLPRQNASAPYKMCRWMGRH